MNDMQPDNINPGLPSGEQDHEGAMAKADLYKLANYSLKLFKKIDDSAQLESWVQAKITKAADYIASVYHYMEYEMKFSEFGAKLENSEMYSESQKAELKNKLMEAKEKVKSLKIAQADKIAVQEGSIFGGHEEACSECGGTGMVMVPERQVPETVKGKVAAYNRKAKAMHAASKRIDANKNGIPDDEEFEEGFDEKSKSGDTFKTRTGVATKTSTGVKHTNTSHSDEEHGQVQDTHAKSRSAAEKKSDAPKQKKSKSGTWGMEGGEKFDNRKKEKAVDETFGQGVYAEGKSKPDFLDMDKDGDKKEPMKKAIKDKKVAETLKGKQKKLDVDNDGDIEGDDLADLRAGKKVAEGSTGDYSAKKAAAGKDIGKPGKNFAKIAKKSGGGEKGAKIAGAVLKNLRAKESIKEAISIAKGRIQNPAELIKTEQQPVVESKQEVIVNESTDLARMKEFLTRLNG